MYKKSHFLVGLAHFPDLSSTLAYLSAIFSVEMSTHTPTTGTEAGTVTADRFIRYGEDAFLHLRNDPTQSTISNEDFNQTLDTAYGPTQIASEELQEQQDAARQTVQTWITNRQVTYHIDRLDLAAFTVAYLLSRTREQTSRDGNTGSGR